MIFRRKLVQEEFDYRESLPKETFIKTILGELEGLKATDPELCRFLDKSCFHLAKVLRDDGAPEDIEREVVGRYLNSQLGLVNILKKELELRELEKVWGKTDG